METDRDASALDAAADFLRRFWLQTLAISAGLLIPCFWHRRIEAGDLASHAYNAWLAQLIERGQAPGLYVARQWNNVLFDLFLLKFGNLFGLPSAQKIAVPLCVLIFFWGVFGIFCQRTCVERPGQGTRPGRCACLPRLDFSSAGLCLASGLRGLCGFVALAA